MIRQFHVTSKSYRGLAPYHDSPVDRELFFGRESEKEKLLNTVLSENLTVLFSRSGLGKTSLINAGILQSLRDSQFFPAVVRLTHNVSGDPVLSIIEDIQKQVEDQGICCAGDLSHGGLWQFFYSAQFTLNGQVLQPVLIIDQFEELFTKIDDKGAFIISFADLVRRRVPDALCAEQERQLSNLKVDDPERQRIVSLLYGESGPQVKVLLSMREDYLPEIESLRTYIPNILRSTVRLEPLSIEGARDAIEKPGLCSKILGDDTFEFAPGVVDEIIAFLSMKRIAGMAVAGDAVDPTQLQVLCWNLDLMRRAQGAKLITSDDLGGQQGMEKILTDHYRSILHRFATIRAGWSKRKVRPSFQNLLLISRPRAAVRRLLERGLVTRSGQRNSVKEEVICDEYGLSEEDVQELVDLHLVRADNRLDSQFFELSHDTLVGPVLADRRRRFRMGLVFLSIAAYFITILPSIRYIREKVDDHATQIEIEAEQRRIEAATPADRPALIEEIARKGHRDFSGLNLQNTRIANSGAFALTPLKLLKADLRNADLHNMVQIGADWSGADLSGANLSGAQIPSTSLKKSKAVKANFSGALLLYVDLSYADARSAVFQAADLTGANLSGANLEGSLLKGAELKGAKVSDVILGNGSDFSETAWWLADGWPQQYWQWLQSQSTPRSFTATSAYKRKLLLLTSEESDKSPKMLNSRAWFRATRGIDLQEGLREVNEALRFEPNAAGLLDTRGYIYLRLGRYEDARRDLESSMKKLPIGENSYHLGLAYEYLGDEAHAREAFSGAARKDYHPTYERLLTPRK